MGDNEYDSLEVYAKMQEGGDILNNVSSDREDDYPDDVKQFAQQLLNKVGHRT